MSIVNTVSIVIVTFKRPQGLDATLKSVAKQSIPADEVIVCDDCSGDNTNEVVAKWQGMIKNLRYYAQSKNLGMPGNLNFGISRASGDIVLNLHDGDVYDEQLVEKCCDAFLAWPSAGLVFWDSLGKGDKHDHIPEFSHGRDFFEHFYLYQRKSFIWGTVAVRKEVYCRLLPFDSLFEAWADVDMWMRICLYYDIVHINEPLVELLDQGVFRVFNFNKVLRVQRMIFLNIYRFYRDKPQTLHRALHGQLKVQRRRWLWHMGGRLKRVELKLLIEGVRLAPKFFRIPQFSEEQIDGPHAVN